MTPPNDTPTFEEWLAFGKPCPPEEPKPRQGLPYGYDSNEARRYAKKEMRRDRNMRRVAGKRDMNEGFEKWLERTFDKHQPAKIPNPNPQRAEDKISLATLRDYVHDKVYKYQRQAQQIMSRLRQQWVQQAFGGRDAVPDEKKNESRSESLGQHPDAKIENPHNIGFFVFIGEHAAVLGDAVVGGYAKVTGGEISGDGSVHGNAKVSGGKISGGSVYDNAKVSGGKISGGSVYGNAQVSGGTISGGIFAGKCRIRGGNWNWGTLDVMSVMPEYKEHFDDEGRLVSGEWDDVPEDVKKALVERKKKTASRVARTWLLRAVRS